MNSDDQSSLPYGRELLTVVQRLPYLRPIPTGLPVEQLDVLFGAELVEQDVLVEVLAGVVPVTDSLGEGGIPGVLARLADLEELVGRELEVIWHLDTQFIEQPHVPAAAAALLALVGAIVQTYFEFGRRKASEDDQTKPKSGAAEGGDT